MTNFFWGILMFTFTSTIFAADMFYCNENELKDLKSGEVIRTFTSIYNKDLDINCGTTLKASKNGLYCNENELKDLKSGAVIRTFTSIYNKDLDINCQTTLNASH
jgi:hypothetical protein